MPAPLAKGIIVVASVLVAASIAIYENPQVRVWVDNSRRKIAIALHSLGDEINPPSQSRRNSENTGATTEAEQRMQRREDIIRANRADLIRRAREHGVAVDLDELEAIGHDSDDEKRPGQQSRSSSFDGMVGSDGRLRGVNPTGTATALEKPEAGLRQRGTGGQAFADGAFANPFADGAHVLFDHFGVDNTAGMLPMSSRESTATLQGDIPPPSNLSGTLPPSLSHHVPSGLVSLDGKVTEASFHSAANEFDMADMDDRRSNGTLTPTDGGFSTSASMAGSNNDIGILSEVLSQAGFSDASFSEVGASTPGSWTDVGSDAGSDDGFGHVSQQV